MNSIVRLDTRGRLVLPNEFREALNLKEGDEVLVSLDSKTDTLTINPVYGKPTDLVKIEIEFGDTPGCLAKVHNVERKLDGTSSLIFQNVRTRLMRLNSFYYNLDMWSP